MLKLDGVHKKFKSALVAEQISVDLGPCTYGLLGRNGSGKTTLLRCITPGGKGKRRAHCLHGRGRPGGEGLFGSYRLPAPEL